MTAWPSRPHLGEGILTGRRDAEICFACTSPGSRGPSKSKIRWISGQTSQTCNGLRSNPPDKSKMLDTRRRSQSGGEWAASTGAAAASIKTSMGRGCFCCCSNFKHKMEQAGVWSVPPRPTRLGNAQ